MEPYTLNRNFLKQDIIDGFSSIIWTERYYGDSEVELVVPATPEMIRKLPEGIFLGLNDSDEIMILETIELEDKKLKAKGISLLSWLNNRFVRTSSAHGDKYWHISDMPPGEVLWTIVYNMVVEGSPYLDGTIDTGVTDPELLVIPGLGLNNYDDTGDNITVGVPYGPLYTALQEIATTYNIGMQIILEDADESSYSLGFRSYRGLNRTTEQTENSVVRFSPHMDSFTDIKELKSIAALKTLVYSFAPGLNPAEGEPDLRGDPGVSSLTGPEYTGFDLRALQIFADDITTDMVGGDPDNLQSILNSRAYEALVANGVIQAVDGEIVPESQFKYGEHYNLGDVIEVQGLTGVVQTARITEYIRSQDQGGERTYPTVAMIS